MRRFLLALLGISVAFALVACDESSSDDETTATTEEEETTTTTTTTATTSVTLTGTLAEPGSASLHGLSGPATSVLDPTLYELYCVTFTNPPLSGTGTFDSDGTFSVTIEDAAGLPVGCFIVESTTGQSVASLTFQVGTASEFDDGTTGSAALEGGSYELTITFDADAGTASADISELAGSTVEVEASFDPASIVGTWQLTCDGTNNDTDVQDSCEDFLEADPDNPFSIYLDVITAVIEGEDVYAMGVWRDRALFIAGGAHEGIPAASVPTGVTVESLNTDVTPADDGVTPGAVGTFLGMATDSGYDAATNAISGSDLVAYLDANGFGYDSTFDDEENANCGTDTDPLDLSQQSHRSCLIDFYERLRDKVESGELAADDATFAGLLLRLARNAHQTFAAPHDDMGEPVVADGDTLIHFETTQVADSPQIMGRYALMDLMLAGDTGVAREFSEHNYADYEYDDDSMMEMEQQCHGQEEITIVFSVDPDNPDSLTGRFTTSESNSCDDEHEHATFLVEFTRQ